MAGGAAIVFLYLEALDVSAINFDATWYHFPIAQDYARAGRIVAFPGENHRAFPHLTSMLHTWALLVPGLPELTQHWMLSLASRVRDRALAHRRRGTLWRAGCWAGATCAGCGPPSSCFPSLFVYDQSIGGSADHFLGFFAVPVVLAAARALERFDVRLVRAARASRWAGTCW